MSQDRASTETATRNAPSAPDAPSGGVGGAGRAAGFRVRAWHAAGIVLLFAVGGLLLYGFWPALTGGAAEDERPVPEDNAGSSAAQVEVVVARPVDFPLRAEATGHLRPWRRAAISAEADGRVIRRPVEEGQYVEQGALLAKLDDREERIELKDARAELLKARAEYAVNTRGTDGLAPSDTSALAAARQQWQKAEAAFAEGTVTRAELETARRRFEAAQVRAGVHREAVQAATYGLTQAEQRVERAQLALERTRIIAPFAGRVAGFQVEVGQRVAPGQVVCTVLDDHPMKVTVEVLEGDLVRIEQGATARIHVPALGEAASETALFDGTVFAINPEVDPGQGTGRVTVSIPNPRGQLVAGLFANVRLETGRLTGRLVVPADAVLVRQGRDLVFRIEDGRAQWTYVTTGARSGNYVAITDGISPGDTIAVDGHFALAHDAPVTVSGVREAFRE